MYPCPLSAVSPPLALPATLMATYNRYLSKGECTARLAGVLWEALEAVNHQRTSLIFVTPCRVSFFFFFLEEMSFAVNSLDCVVKSLRLCRHGPPVALAREVACLEGQLDIIWNDEENLGYFLR